MKLHATYRCKIKHYNHIFSETTAVYRRAVDFLIEVCNAEWDSVAQTQGNKARQRYVETLVHAAGLRKEVSYDFDRQFYKFPCYLLRAAITEAIGKVSSYRSNLARWKSTDPRTRGSRPSVPKAGYLYPCMYRGNMYKETGAYTAQVKVFIRNTWD